MKIMILSSSFDAVSELLGFNVFEMCWLITLLLFLSEFPFTNIHDSLPSSSQTLRH